MVPLYDLGYILSNDGECGEVCCPDYIVDPTGLHPDAAAGEERMGKAFLLMLRDLYFGSGCTNLAPPTVPAGFSGTALSESSIKLAWEPAVHECGIARYEVTRNGTFLAATTKTNYTDTGLTENTSYGYAVRAVSMAEAVSSYSSTATISTLPDSLAPTIVSSEAISASQVSIVFSENLNVVSAQTAANYSLNYGVSVLSASVSGHVVTLSTSPMSDGTNYTLTISNVTDNSSAKNPVAPGTQTFFTYIANTYPDSPTAWWKFDRTLDDASGNSLTGTWKNSTGTFTNALLGQGVSLTGGSTGSYVHVVHNNLLDGMTNGMSISIWAKKQTAAIGGELFKKHVVYHLNISSNTVAGYVFAGGSSKYFSVSSVSDINNTNWHHYCMVYNGSNITVHVDGTQRGTYPLTGAVANVITQPLYIGYDPFGGPMVFNGQLDEMKIFRRVLSTNEIYGLYANGLAGSADRQAVRNILDSNNLTNKQVDAISVYENDRIIKLYLQESGVSSIPADIGQLSKLKLLHCYGDRNLGFPLLTQIAPEIGNCTRINELLLAQNDLSELPATLTNLTALTTCSIGDNLLCNANPAWESWADTYDPDWWTTQNCGDAPVIHPVLTSFGRGQDVISWIPGPGHVYHVYYSTNLQQGFQPLETNLPDTVQSLTNTISAPSVFYKIEAR